MAPGGPGGAGPHPASSARAVLSAAALGALLLVVARALDAEPLYVPGLAFLVLAAASVVWVLGGGTGVRVARTISLRTVQEDEPVLVTLVATSPRPLPTGAVIDELLPHPAPLATGRRRTEVRITARFARRGRKVLAPPRIAVRDPLNLFVRLRSAGGEQSAAEVLVLPRVDPVGPPRDGAGDGGQEARSGQPLHSAQIEPDGLRTYRPGTTASRIYWPSLARRGELMERRLRSEQDTDPLIVLDPRMPAGEDDLDAAVRACASLAVHLGRKGGCAVLLPGDRRPTQVDANLASWPRLHVRLALLDGTGTPALGAIAARRGPVIWISARRLSRAPRGLQQSAAAGRTLVVPGLLEGRRASFEVSGCHGYLLSAATRTAVAS